jgi:hypothetical protein
MNAKVGNRIMGVGKAPVGKQANRKMHDVAHFSGLLSERVLAVRPAGSV